MLCFYILGKGNIAIISYKYCVCFMFMPPIKISLLTLSKTKTLKVYFKLTCTNHITDIVSKS